MSRTITLENDEIAIVWSVADVLEVRPDLTEDQAYEVLQQADHKHDATIGISWDVLDCHASWLFPKKEFSRGES